MHCSSFNKCLAPGYCVGWVAGGRFAREIARQKTMTTLMTSMPGQLGLAHYLQGRQYERHLRQLRATLAARCRQMSDAVSRHFPEGTCATEPEGGYVLWVQMPDGVDALELQRHAHAHQFCVVPGSIFSASGTAFGNCVRLNFSYPFNERMERALQGLGAAAKRQMPELTAVA